MSVPPSSDASRISVDGQQPASAPVAGEDGTEKPLTGAEKTLAGSPPVVAIDPVSTAAEAAVALPVDASSAPVDTAAPQDTAALLIPPPAVLPVVAITDLDWDAVRTAASATALRARMRSIVERMETLLDRDGGPGLLFDNDRAHVDDRTIRVSAMDDASPLWIIGDLHGDLLALEAALAQIGAHATAAMSAGVGADAGPDSGAAADKDNGNRSGNGNGIAPRIIFLGDFIDDEGFGLELLLRVFELIVDAPERICVIAGNHDEALAYDGVRFTSSVSPSDFTDFLNANLAHEWIERAGKLAVRLTAQRPRALFFPDGLLVAHGGFPLLDLHPRLLETGDWNDPACLVDFVWARAHPKARRKMPNRFSRGSQFGYEDFADFCALSAKLGRPVTHMARGHDHPEQRFAIHPAYQAHPVLTTVALSRRLHREQFGPHERAPTIARVIKGALPQVHQLHIPTDMVNEFFPQPGRGNAPAAGSTGEAQA